MAYNHFTNNKPSGADDGPDVVADIEKNLQALRDMIAASGGLPGWDYAKTDGTGSAEQPQYMTWAYDANVKIRATLTWGTTGGEAGNVTGIVWDYTEDNFSTTDNIGTQTLAFDANGNPTTITWS